MVWAITEELLFNKNIKKHAGGKAREDLDTIFSSCEIRTISIIAPQSEREKANIFQKLIYHNKVAQKWKKALNEVERGDIILLQFPVSNHTLFLSKILKKLKRRGVLIYAFIHDLEYLRNSNESSYTWIQRWRMKNEEIDELILFDKIVVHNSKMKELMNTKMNISDERMVSLDIFDYLINDEFEPLIDTENINSCIIAGSLDRIKSAYIYSLPTPPEYNLYGVDFEGSDNEDVHYHGAFLADELPYHLIGGFGLVWDGNSIYTCSGVYGDYLRYNNPHKTSLYLACGIPVIIWEGAALAKYVIENKVGITVKSLTEIKMALDNITEDEYKEIKKNAMNISKELRKGNNTKRVLEELKLI